MKSSVQQAAVRVIASELDRRAAPLEQAVRDTNVRLNHQAESDAALKKLLGAIQAQIGAVAAAQDRIAARLDDLGERVRRTEDLGRAHAAELARIRLDVDAVGAGLAEITSVVETAAS